MNGPTSYDREAAWAKMEPPAGTHPLQLKPENFDNVGGYWVTGDLLLRSAVYYGQNNRPVFPCCPWDGAYKRHDGSDIDAKAPLVRNGWKDATTDEFQICNWWTQFPYAMIGSPVPADEIVLDIDPRSGGDRWRLAELAGITELPITRMVLSGRYDGGHHLFYQRPLGQLTDIRIKKIGVDLRAGGSHYTILPPSIHNETGGVYQWRGLGYNEETRRWQWDAPAAALPAEIGQLLEPVTVERVAVTTYETNSRSLAGILRKVGEQGPDSHNRQSIGFWAAGKLLNGNYPLQAWDAVEGVLRANGATNHDVRTALRERPDRRYGA
jgi:hypothetical protein